MKNVRVPGLLLAAFLFAAAAFGQAIVVVHDPRADSAPSPLGAADERFIQTHVLPSVRKKIVSDICTEEFRASGIVKGAFTKPKSMQTLVFYQFCETGNGLGQVGVAVFENDRLLGSFVSDVGWAVDLKMLPDINRNGLNEFALYYSGGLHQGQGGVGVDIVEFSDGRLKPHGWFQADNIAEEENENYSYRVTARTGKTPVFYHQKYIGTETNRLRKSGANARFSLGEAVGVFVPVN